MTGTGVTKIFDIRPDRLLAHKYVVVQQLGRDWESEVFMVCERHTDIERAVRLFYPQHNRRDRGPNRYARKLWHCPIAIQYHTHDCAVVLASDGVFENLYVSQVIDLVRTGPLAMAGARLFEQCERRMTQAGEEHPGKPDDLTFVLYRAQPYAADLPQIAGA